MKLRQIAESEYAGLEDADEFRDNNFCWCGNEWQDGDRVTYCYKCNQAMCDDCQSYLGGHNYICQDCIADEDFARESNIRESLYADLEDADEFDDITACDNCQDRGNNYRCDACRAVYLCGNCIANYDLEDPSGQLIVCPNCKQSDAYADMVRDQGPHLGESIYHGLEDDDEFEENQDDLEIEAMNEMGHTPDSLGIPPELQVNGIELSSGANAYWKFGRWVHEDQDVDF